jgi:uncharacterized protein YdeI (BOF family)
MKKLLAVLLCALMPSVALAGEGSYKIESDQEPQTGANAQAASPAASAREPLKNSPSRIVFG